MRKPIMQTGFFSRRKAFWKVLNKIEIPEFGQFREKMLPCKTDPHSAEYLQNCILCRSTVTTVFFFFFFFIPDHFIGSIFVPCGAALCNYSEIESFHKSFDFPPPRQFGTHKRTHTHTTHSMDGLMVDNFPPSKRAVTSPFTGCYYFC